MRKIAVVLLIVGCVLCLGACSLFYTFSQTQDGTIQLGYGKWNKKSFVIGYDWQVGMPQQVELPSQYLGTTVDALGGYTGRGYPCPFAVRFASPESMYPGADEYFSTDASMDVLQNGEVQVDEYVFSITLPDSLREIRYVVDSVSVAAYQTQDGPVYKVAKALYRFTIAEDNPYFYTRDGKLYDKGTDRLVDEFAYAQ